VLNTLSEILKRDITIDDVSGIGVIGKEQEGEAE
jgi:hypothetical protein